MRGKAPGVYLRGKSWISYFSKKVENLACMLALHYMHYNFCRVHKTLGMTPAMAAGLADHPWSIGKIVGLLEKTLLPADA